MGQYFTNDDNLKSELFTYKCSVLNQELTLFSDNGVFAKNGLDFGTSLLIETFKNPDIEGKLCDLGCGNGVIGIALNKAYNRESILVDVNSRAINLANKNIEKNKANCKAINTNVLDGISEEFSVILTNPPIRAGKVVVYSFFTESFNHLKNSGELWFVMRRSHGVESAIKKIDELFNNHEVVKRKNGFWIVKAIKLN